MGHHHAGRGLRSHSGVGRGSVSGVRGDGVGCLGGRDERRQIYAFGSNLNGELGNTTNNGTSNENPTPSLVSIPGGAGGKLLAVGQNFSLAVTSTSRAGR